MGLKCRTGFLKSIRFSRHLYRAIILIKTLFFQHGHYGHFGQKWQLWPEVNGEACEHFREELGFQATAAPRARVMQVDAVIIHPP